MTTRQIDMKKFMGLVKQGNRGFTLKRSSLQEVITALGGPYKSGYPWRNLTRSRMLEVQEAIWPHGEGTAESPWGHKKRQYAAALGYLAQQIFNLAPSDALLVGSYKTGWTVRTLQQAKQFFHISGVTDNQIHSSGGLKPEKASEVCIPEGGLIGDWALGHKFTFLANLKTNAQGHLLVGSGGALKNMGFGKNVYVVQKPAGTRYMSTFDPESSPDATGEIAFPNMTRKDDITVLEVTKGIGKRKEPHPW